MTVEALLMRRAQALEAELAAADVRIEQLAEAIKENGTDRSRLKAAATG